MTTTRLVTSRWCHLAVRHLVAGSFVVFIVHLAVEQVVRHRNQLRWQEFSTSLLDSNHKGNVKLCSFQHNCFGSKMCIGDQLTKKRHISSLTVNPASASVGVDFMIVDGTYTDSYGVEKNASFKTPLSPSCGGFCDVFSTGQRRAAMCARFSLPADCDVIETVERWKQLNDVLSSRGRLDPAMVRQLSTSLRCSTQRLCNRILMRAVPSKASDLLSDFTGAEITNLLLMGKVFPGSLIQIAFPPNEGWGTRKLVGGCGVTVVEGATSVSSLFHIYDSTWAVRVDVAVQLLDMAHHLTENADKFQLLLHHLTLHDFGVSSSGKLKIVNADRIVAVDVHDSGAKSWNASGDETPYEAENFKFPASNEICNSRQTDLNYYAVCRHILAGSWTSEGGGKYEGGLLHHPVALQTQMSMISVLVDLCVRGSLAVPRHQREPTVQVRRLAAAKLREVLSEMRECDSRFRYRFPECEWDSGRKSLYSISDFEFKWLH